MAKKKRKFHRQDQKTWGRSKPKPAKAPSPKRTPPHRNMTWREAAGKRETAASLDPLPPGVAFAEDFPEPIMYDIPRKLLIYRGFMSHASYDYLHQLSNDPAYGIALDLIYAQSASPASSRRGRVWILTIIVIASLGVWWWLR